MPDPRLRSTITGQGWCSCCSVETPEEYLAGQQCRDTQPPCTCPEEPYNCPQGQALAQAILERKGTS